MSTDAQAMIARRKALREKFSPPVRHIPIRSAPPRSRTARPPEPTQLLLPMPLPLSLAPAVPGLPDTRASGEDMLLMIAQEVSVRHAISMEALFSMRRTRNLTMARREFFARATNETAFSLAAIGRFAGYDHTTVIHHNREYDRSLQDGSWERYIRDVLPEHVATVSLRRAVGM